MGKKRTTYLITFLISLVVCLSQAETRGEYQDREDLKKPYIYNSRRIEKVNAAENDVGNQIAEKKKPGFYQLKSEQVHTSSSAATVINSHTSPVSVDNILILKVSCPTGLNDFSVPAKYMNLKWEIIGIEFKSEPTTGSIQSDLNGVTKIHFQSNNPIASQRIKIEFGTMKKEFTLGVGPYEILVDQKDCNQRN